MKKLYILLIFISLVTACKPVQTVIEHHETVTHYVDSVRYIDSTVLIPQEYFYNVAWPYDTLHLETSLAEASCWVDSLMLRGEMRNKKVAQTHVIHETETIYHDSLVYVDKPVPYDVVKEVKNPVNWRILLWAILSSLGLCGVLYLHFRGRIYKLFT